MNSASFDDDGHYCYHHHFVSSTITIIITFISVYFYFSFVSNSLAYITIPQNNGKMKINRDKNLLQHICVFFLLYNTLLILNLNTSLLNLNTASFDDDNDDHYYYCYHHHFLVVQLLSLLLLLLLLLLSLLSSSSSLFCVSECFLTLISILFLWASRLSVHGHQTIQPIFFFLLFIYLFILSTFTQSFLFFLFVFFYVQLPCVG